jgi:hypothetical protein
MAGEITEKFYSQAFKNVVGNMAGFVGCLHSLLNKKGQPEWLAPSPKECAWDYNGTNSSLRTGLGRITTCNPSANPNGIFQDEELNFGPLSAFLPPVAKTLSPNFLQ